MTGDVELETKADRMFQTFAHQVTAFPKVYTQFLNAVDFMVGPTREIVIAGDFAHREVRAMIEVVHRIFLPNKVLLFHSEGNEGQKLSALAPYTAMLGPLGSKPAAYVCEQHACKNPITDAAILESILS